jgi:hypothetical protein
VLERKAGVWEDGDDEEEDVKKMRVGSKAKMVMIVHGLVIWNEGL